MIDPIYRDDVQCFVRELRYDFKQRMGHLMLEYGACTDMRGCINLFKKIDTDVQAIATYAGGRRDTAYLLKDGKWESRVAPDERPKGSTAA
jgi:hypothetical protein